MAKKRAIYKGIHQIPVFFEDTSNLSPDIFDVTFLPTILTSGKNLIKLKGNLNNLKPNSVVDVEILDANNNPIYSEFIDYLDEDGARVLAIHIYEDTTPGDCMLTIIGCIQQLNGQSIPNEFRDKTNVKWQTFISVNPTMDNNSEIIFANEPVISIEENVGVQLDRVYTNGQFPDFEPTGPVSYNLRNNIPYIELNPAVSDSKFTGDMVNGIVTFSNITNAKPTPNITPNSTEFRGRIRKFLSDTSAVLYNPYIIQSSSSLSTHTFNSFDTSNISLKFEADPSYVATQNSESFALLQIKNLEPNTGDISRIKVYSNSKGTVGTWELINDVVLDGTEIFIDSSGSLTPDESIGLFKSQNDINTFWTSKFYQGNSIGSAPTLQSKSGSLMRAAAIVSSADLQPSNSVLVTQHNNNYIGFFTSESTYRLSFDAFCERSTNDNFQDPKLSIYASGSAFNYDSTDIFNQPGVLPVKLGKKIGELKLTNNSSRKFYNQEIEFNSDKEGNGDILFVVENGAWEIANIETNTFAEIGYTPNYTRVRSEIPTKHKSGNQLSFKVEYFNKAGVKSKTVSYLYDNNWQGGNRYIDGDFSMLTGSLFVADSLSTGVEIAGLPGTGYVRSLGYEGFNQATGSGAGGFLLFSGSALPQQTATSYQGVGLELVSNANNFFKYRTNPSILDIHTETFFLGNPSTQFISGSNGQLEISSSGYHIQPNGDITASRFLMEGGTINAGVDILGSVTTNQLFVPAGTNKTNARAYISSSGEAGFVGDGAGNYSLILDGRTGQTSTISGLTASAHSLSTATYTISSSVNTSDPVSFISSSAFKVSAGGVVTGSAILLGDKGAGNFLQFDDGTLTVQGSITADNIRTPATIGGSPSTDSNASSSITSDGFASFKSASIAGFVVNTEEIKSSNDNLRLKSSGEITGSNVLFTGGKIANFNIDGHSLSTTGVEINDSTQDIFISSSNFKVSHQGDITASNVDLAGKISATSGDIGGFSIDAATISSSNNNLILRSTGVITGSDVFFNGGTIGGFTVTADKISGNNIVIDSAGSIQTSDYASDLKGWKLSSLNNGFLEVENAKIRGTLSTAVFEKETVNAVGGQLYVANSTTLTSSALHTSDQYLPTDTTMSVVNVTGFAAGEILSLKKVSNTGFSTEYIKIESSSRADSSSDTDFAGSIYVERGYSGSSAAGQSTASLGDSPGAPQPYSGSQVIVSTGKVGSGFIRLNANPNNEATPYIDIVERTGSAIYDVALKARLGDLSGLANSDLVFNKSNPGFGLATDNVYLQGGITATFGTIGGFAITSNAISSSNDNLILKDTGEITGSNVLFTGGDIGGFTIDGHSLSSTGVEINNSTQTLFLSSSEFKVDHTGNITGSSVLLEGGTIGGFDLTSTHISSSGLLLKSSGEITASKVLLEGGTITSGVTILGSVTANAIRTPATIGGSPSTDTNASSSIKSDGFATFKSASIAGFEISNAVIQGGFIPASSSVTNVTVSASLQADGVGEATGVSIDSFTTNAADGAAFWESYRAAGNIVKIVGPENSFAGERNNAAVNNVAGAAGTINLTSPSEVSEEGFTNAAFTLTDNGGTALAVVSSSTVNFPATAAPLQLKSNGEITASAGLIGGTEIISNKLQSTSNLPAPDGNSAFSLNSDGSITGSDLFIRNVFDVDGTDTAFELINTQQGFVKSRNIGRQIVSDITEYTRNNVDDGSSYTTVASYISALMPGEDKIMIYLDAQTFNSAGSGFTAGSVRLQMARSISGSNASPFAESSKYNEFESATTMATLNPGTATTSANFRNFSGGPGDNAAMSYSVPTADQATKIKIDLQINCNPDSANTLKGVRVTNIVVIATSAFAGDFSTNAELLAKIA